MEIHPITLCGSKVRLVPLSVKHIPGLVSIGLEPKIWNYMLYGSMDTEDDMAAWVRELLDRQAKGTDLPFAVIYQESGFVIGATRFLDINPENRSLEIGGTWYGINYQRTGVNTEAKYLLLRHAFEVLECIRVQLKTDFRNERSQKSIERLGAVKEGVIRNHMILPNGFIRDSVIYSVIDKEWPSVRNRLEAMMDKLSNQE